jgi:hypothetical protein
MTDWRIQPYTDNVWTMGLVGKKAELYGIGMSDTAYRRNRARRSLGGNMSEFTEEYFPFHPA